MAEQESEKSAMIEDEDLEDGEIEDDDEPETAPPAVVIKPSEPQKSTEKEKSSQKKKSSSTHSTHDSHHSSKKSSASSSRKDKSNIQDEDDFMSNIENAIAENLKKSGIEPPMPSVKKPSEPEPESDRRQQSRNSRKRRNRKRDRKDQKRENISKKRAKVSDNDGFYMVGGSPNQSGSDTEDEEASNSSYDSDEYQRTTYEERRNKRRDRYGSNRDRDRDRDRDRKDKKNRDRQEEKEVCLRFAEYGHCADDDCQRSHDVRQPKKMELCKFWLMECCAKKDKCSYMHGDFPCKYYYLGLKCVNKDCKFSHGRPLSDNLKQILLKHLDTAPKEILGDFPRIGRENANKMIAQTHIKLCKEFNVPLPESEKEKNSIKIPSLLEMNLKPPLNEFKNEKRSNKNSSRWLDTNSPLRDSPQRSTAIKEECVGPGGVVLADLRGILSEKQVESMAAIGVITVNHINNLTVAQLNDLGLSLATIGEIQATAMNMDQRMSNVMNEKKAEREVSPPSQKTIEDIDLREPLPGLQNLDVDMRVVPSADLPESAKSPDTIMSPNQSDVDEHYKKPDPPAQRPSSSNMMMSPPSGLDYSQYLKDSNLNNDDEVEDEPGLRIDETYCTSDYEQEDKKDSQSEDDQQCQDDTTPNFKLELLPPSFDTSNFLKSTVVTKIDVSSSVSQLMEKETPKPVETPSPSRDPRMRDPRMAQKSSPAEKESSKIPEISSPTYRDPRQKVETPRTSIYEIESPSEDEDLVKIDRDKDMRIPPFLRDSENGDVDLRFPFTPMSNYVPATEIEASYGTFVFEKYEVKIVDVPKPDYSEIRKCFRQSENMKDPRLKKLCGILEDTATSTTAANKTGLSNILPMDPRKRKMQDSKDEASATPRKLQISTILQNSKHYNELSSSQKMIVNEVLAELSKQLKLFHADSSLNKIFDAGFITQRPKLQQILIGLGVFVNADGDFEEIKEMPMVTMPNIHQLPPMIPNLPPPNLMTLNQPPPNFLSGNIRPGLLGIAPNLPFGNNFDGQDSHVMNFPPMNQGMPFGDQFNNRDFGSNQNNRRDQRQQNSSFRNNNNRNNNYSRHRRN